MRRHRSAGGILAAAVLCIAGTASATSAQDASPMAMTGSPLVGTWVLDTFVEDPTNPPSTAIFDADGTYVQVDAGGAVGMGAWEPTGADTADLIIVSFGPDEQGVVSRTTVRAAVEVAADGQSLSADFTVEFSGPDGNGSGQLGPVTASGVRVVSEPMGTPVGPLVPPPSAAPSAAGSAAP